MEIAFYLIIPTFFFGAVVLAALIWSIKNKQYDDLDGAANRILLDDEQVERPGGDNE